MTTISTEKNLKGKTIIEVFGEKTIALVFVKTKNKIGFYSFRKEEQTNKKLENEKIEKITHIEIRKTNDWRQNEK